MIKTYLTELAPWQRKNVYYQKIQLGKDLNNQVKQIHQQSKALISKQIENSNEIIASQKRIQEINDAGFSDLSSSLFDVQRGIAGLQSAFEWGISEVVWQIEQNTAVLKEILELLSAPLDTQAKELKKRAEEAYANGWHNDALDDFILSEKMNRYDFSIHISMGMIYLFQFTNKSKALTSFNKAIKYARPKSHYHTSFSLLYRGIILFDMGEIVAADASTCEAIELTPSILEAHYQNAIYNAHLGNIQICLDRLQHCFERDKRYLLKANSDHLLDIAREHINQLIIKMNNEKQKQANDKLEDVKSKIELTNDILKSHRDLNISTFHIDSFEDNVKRIEQLLNLNSYFDTLKSLDEIQDLQNSFKFYFEKFKEKLAKEQKTLSDKIQLKRLKVKQGIEDSNKATTREFEYINKGWQVLSFIIGSVVGFKACGINSENFMHIHIGHVFVGFLKFIGVLIIAYLIGFILIILTDIIKRASLKSKNGIRDTKTIEEMILKTNQIKQIQDNLLKQENSWGL